MRRYAALLRGVSPMNAKMAELKRAFEGAGFTDVKTVLASGNVVFTAPATPAPSLERAAEAAMQKLLGRTFLTIVRPIDTLREIIASDPYRIHRLKPGTKRVVTFLRSRVAAKLTLPIEREGARILAVKGSNVFSAYVRTPKGPVFMTLLQQTFGKEQTTRTWETVTKLCR
ncbi:MAG TPA: DUF1697 domain-containing protein [Gemmatimonadales bacterium]|nr:DUF1697 domain-containing protein [Gemmatimonadales bacterium]